MLTLQVDCDILHGTKEERVTNGQDLQRKKETEEVLAELARRDLNKKITEKHVIKDVDKEQ
jgi:hypothetical protein